VPDLAPDDARQLLAAGRVGHLATVAADGRPNVVACCYAVSAAGTALYSPVDDKPKRTSRLARLAAIEAHPDVTLLVDHYEDDWERLWWVRARGRARVLADGPERAAAVARLREQYAPYREHALDQAVIAVDVDAVTGWSATGSIASVEYPHPDA